MIKFDLLSITIFLAKQGFDRLCPASKIAQDLRDGHD